MKAAYAVVGSSLSATMCVSVHISANVHVVVAGLKPSRMVFDKWQAALQKAAMRWLTNSRFGNNWELGLLSAGDSVYLLPCQGSQEDILAETRRGEERRSL